MWSYTIFYPLLGIINPISIFVIYSKGISRERNINILKITSREMFTKILLTLAQNWKQLIFMKRRIDKQTKVYSYNGILYNIKEWITDILHNMDRLQIKYIRRKKSDTKD